METELNTKNIKIYTLPACPFCIRAKDLLRERGVDFEEIDISQAQGRERFNKEGDYKTVPQIFIENKHFGGHDDLVALIDSGKFEEKFKL